MRPTMESLRLLDHCVILLLWAAMTSCFNVTFEEKDVEWRIAQQIAPFVLTTGWKAVSTGKTKYPRRDFTLGSQKGQYVVADGKHGNDTKVLYSACLNPMGPKCALNFHTWIGRSDRGLEELKIYLLKYCHVCGGSNETETGRLSYVVYNTEGDAQRWVHHRVKIGPVHSLFVLTFLAAVPHDDSVLALDGLYLESCDLERETHSCKPDEFQCSYTTQCIPRVNVCDMEEECMCGEDESDNTCGAKEGFVFSPVAKYEDPTSLSEAERAAEKCGHCVQTLRNKVGEVFDKPKQTLLRDHCRNNCLKKVVPDSRNEDMLYCKSDDLILVYDSSCQSVTHWYIEHCSRGKLWTQTELRAWNCLHKEPPLQPDQLVADIKERLTQDLLIIAAAIRATLG